MITAVFTDGDDCVWAYGLWQWDYGQQLRIEGLHLPTVVEIHFSLQEAGGEAVPRVGVTKDGITTVTIPDSMLEGAGAVRDYQVYAWVYLSDRTFGETTKQIMMKVKARSKPEAFDAPGDGEIFHQAIEAVNDAAKRAEEAGDKAVAAADEAKAAATQTAEYLQTVQGFVEQVEINADTVAQDKQAVAGMLSQTQQAASEAALSAQTAKLSETAAGQAQTGAEAAEDIARQYAEETEADRQAVANDKQAVTQMREDVAADRQAVEQTATQFGQTAQDALTAIGQAQSTAVGDVKAEGNKQTTAVQEAGTQAVKDITTEGDKQTKRVEDVAANLVDGVMDLAPAILNTASGSVITADDAAEGRPFRGMRVFGKSTQVRTEGKNLLSNNLAGWTVGRALEWGANKESPINLIGNPRTAVIDIPIKSSANYFFVNKEKGKLWVNRIIEKNSEGQGVKNHALYKNESDNLDQYTFSTTEDTASIFFQIASVNINESITEEDIQNNLVMFAEGSSPTPYEPYTGGKPSPSPEYPQKIVSAGEGGRIEVEVTGKNLFDINGDVNIKANGDKADGVNTVENGVLISNADTAKTYSTGQKIFVTPGKKYSASAKILSIGTGRTARIDIVQSNPYKLLFSKSVVKGYLSGTFVSDTDEIIVALGCDGGTGSKYTEIQLEESDAPTPYEPYREHQTLTLQTPNGLPGVPVAKDGNYTDSNGQQWICDEIDLERGKYVQRISEKEVSEITWSGAGSWGNTDDYKTLAFYAYIDGSNINKDWDAVKNYGICNYATITSNVFNNSIIGFTLGDYIAFRVPRNLLPDWDENNASTEPWINWLKMKKETGNPVIVRYALKTPIERDLTPEEIAAYKALRTYGPTTVMSNDAGAGMEVTYVADTKAYIQNLEQRLSAKLVNIQSALISQKTSGGGHLIIADSSPLPVEEFGMIGKTEQRKMSGKNLMDKAGYRPTTDVSLPAGTKIFVSVEEDADEFAVDVINVDGSTHVISLIETKDNRRYGFRNLTVESKSIRIRGTVKTPFLAVSSEYIPYEPYTGGQPSPSPDYPQPIEVTDHPIAITVKGSTESQSITLTPPRPFTKLDRMENVNGVWCWVYQSRFITDIKDKYTGNHAAGAMMISIKNTGIAETQSDSFCDKFLYANKAISELKNGEFRIAYQQIYLKVDEVTTAEQGRQWLESNSVLIITQADIPEYIPLAASEQAQLNAITMYAPETEITNNGGCTMDLTYTADTKTYIDTKLAAISAAMIGGT